MAHVLALSDRTEDRVVLFLGADGEHLMLGTLRLVYTVTGRPPLYPLDLMDTDCWLACSAAVELLGEIQPATHR